jgi:hypothetical protein
MKPDGVLTTIDADIAATELRLRQLHSLRENLVALYGDDVAGQQPAPVAAPVVRTHAETLLAACEKRMHDIRHEATAGAEHERRHLDGQIVAWRSALSRLPPRAEATRTETPQERPRWTRGQVESHIQGLQWDDPQPDQKITIDMLRAYAEGK